MTIPDPPAPPNGAMPLLIAVKIATPLACLITSGGILRSTLAFFFALPSVTVSSLTTPSTDYQRQSPARHDRCETARSRFYDGDGDHHLPVKARRILAHLSISFTKSPVTGQKCSVPNRFSAILFTLFPMLSDQTTPLSIAYLPQAEPFVFILAFQPASSGVVVPL